MGMTIGELGRRARIAPSAIRFYESEGLLPKPSRISGRRVYDDDSLHTLALIRLAQQAGFTISEIGKLLGGFSQRTKPPARWRALATSKLEEVQEQRSQLKAMERLLRHLLDCRCPTLEDCARMIPTLS